MKKKRYKVGRQLGKDKIVEYESPTFNEIDWGANFKCIRGLSNYNALCLKCIKEFPYMAQNCNEWKKKEAVVACGCNGTWYCLCGYNERTCIPILINNKKGTCKFCGRELEYSGGLSIALNWPIIKNFGGSDGKEKSTMPK